MYGRLERLACQHPNACPLHMSMHERLSSLCTVARLQESEDAGQLQRQTRAQASAETNNNLGDLGTHCDGCGSCQAGRPLGGRLVVM